MHGLYMQPRTVVELKNLRKLQSDMLKYNHMYLQTSMHTEVFVHETNTFDANAVPGFTNACLIGIKKSA